jgi:tetratricopeptide (TPR) repeat protein
MQNNEAEPLRLIAVEHMKAGRYADAVTVLQKAVVVSPNDDNLWRILGGALSNVGETQAALDAFSQAIAIAPNVARNHFNLGVALEQLGRYEDAKTCYRAAIGRDPAYILAQQRLSNLESAYPESPRTVPFPMAEPLQTGIDTFVQTHVGGWGSESMPTGGGQRQQQRPLPSNVNKPGGIRPGLGTSYAARQGLEPDGVPASTIFALGIVGIAGGFSCGLPMVCAPIAWIMGNKALARIDELGNVPESMQQQVRTGRTLGIVGTVLLALGALALILIFGAGIIAD